jgi:hypothetical protein
MGFDSEEVDAWAGLMLRRIRLAREEATCIPRGVNKRKGSVYCP